MTTTTATGNATAAVMLARLERHLIPQGQQFPGGFLVPEVTPLIVPDAMNGKLRRADALFVGFTNGNRGLHGYEIKVSRGDWLTELGDLTKSSAWADACHTWWIVAPDTTVVRPEELPPGWGLLTIGNARTRLTITVPATLHEAHEPPWWAVISVMARWDTLRGHVVGEAHRARLAAEREATRARDNVDRLVEAEVARRLAAGTDASAAAELLAEVEGAIGYRIIRHDTGWDEDTIGLDALRRFAMLLAGERDLSKAARVLTRRSWAVQEARGALDSLQSALARLDEIARDPEILATAAREDAEAALSEAGLTPDP